MVSYSAKLDSRTKQHTQFGVSASNGSRDMAPTKVAEKKRKKNEHGQNYIASPTGIAKYVGLGVCDRATESKFREVYDTRRRSFTTRERTVHLLI